MIKYLPGKEGGIIKHHWRFDVPNRKSNNILLLLKSIPALSESMIEKHILNWAVAHVVRRVREAADLTQVELADFAGLSKPYVSGLERGNINASIYALARIAEVVKVAPTDLMEQVEKEIRKGPTKPEPLTGRPVKKG